MLDLAETMEELLAGFKDILGENVLFTIHIEERESFLSRIKNFCQVAQTLVNKENSVSL